MAVLRMVYRFLRRCAPGFEVASQSPSRTAPHVSKGVVRDSRILYGNAMMKGMHDGALPSDSVLPDDSCPLICYDAHSLGALPPEEPRARGSACTTERQPGTLSSNSASMS